MCPPSCPDIEWFIHLIESYEKIMVFFEIIDFSDKYDLTNKRNLFHAKLLENEHRLKRQGEYYALCFVSGACTLCERNKCNSNECKRPLVGRTPICAAGIDLMHLSTEVLGLSKELSLAFWRPNLSKDHFDKTSDEYLCLGAICY